MPLRAVGEGEREDARPRRHRCGSGVAATLQVRPRSLEWKTRAAPGAASAEPGFARAEQGEAGIAGGEGAFVGQSGGRIAAFPVDAAIVGGANFGAAIQLVADDDAVVGVPEGDGVEETFGIGVRELERPVLAGVGGLVDARFVAGARDIR